MKIIFANQNNNLNQVNYQKKNQEISFEAGLTPKMMQEIQRADVLEISSKLAKKGIPTDFKGNKVIAWCSDKTVDIFQQLNEKYKLKLALPKGIFVEDFEKLNVDNPNRMYGFCNLFPIELKKYSEEQISEKTLFFNTFESVLPNIPNENKWRYDWNFINEIADEDYANKISSSDNFLYPIFHEFSHVLHEEHLLKKFNGKVLLTKIQNAYDNQQIKEFQMKYASKISQICNYASANQIETIGCDIPRRIIAALDKTTLTPTKNPFAGTPYENLSFWQRRIKDQKKDNQELTLDGILRNFWNGKFD